MAELRKFKTDKGISYNFWCPACQETHSFDVREDGKEPTWTFDGNFENPTFTPSLRYPKCHLTLQNGVVDYLTDCRHRYAGRKILFKEL